MKPFWTTPITISSKCARKYQFTIFLNSLFPFSLSPQCINTYIRCTFYRLQQIAVRYQGEECCLCWKIYDAIVTFSLVCFGAVPLHIHVILLSTRRNMERRFYADQQKLKRDYHLCAPSYSSKHRWFEKWKIELSDLKLHFQWHDMCWVMKQYIFWCFRNPPKYPRCIKNSIIPFIVLASVTLHTTVSRRWQ